MMKRGLFLVLSLLLLCQFGAASLIGGWVETPWKVEISNYTIEVKDVSLLDGSVSVEYLDSTGNKHSHVLKIGQNLSLGPTFLKIHRTIVGENGHVYISLEYPYILEGETIKFGNYSLSLLSVGNESVKSKLVFGNESKEYDSTKIEYGPLRIELTPFPKIFSGYFKKGETFTFYSHSITFEKALVKNVSGKYKNVVQFLIDDVEYQMVVGETLKTKAFVISTKELIGVEYVMVEIYLNGAYADVYLSPQVEMVLKEKESMQIGPYLITPEYIFPSKAYVSIRDLCRDILDGGFLTIGEYSRALTYREIEIGLLSVNSTSESKSVKLVGFVRDPSIFDRREVIPEVELFLTLPTKVLQFDEIPLKVTIKNNDRVDLKNIQVVYTPSTEVKPLGSTSLFIPKIESGKSYEVEFLVKIEEYGKISLGNIKLIVETSSGFNCSRNGTIHLPPYPLTAYVEKAVIGYELNILTPDSVDSTPFEAIITVKNIGNIGVPVQIRIPISELAVLNADFFSFNTSYIESLVKLSPNQSRNFKIKIVPLKAGNITLSAYAIFNGEIIAKTDRLIEVFQNTTCNREVIYVNKTVPVYVNKTIEVPVEKVVEKTVNNTIEVPYTPLKSKLLFSSFGFVLGVGVIVLIAWIQARRG